MKLEPGMTAWVSGAGSGIGRGIARELAARGLKVAVVDIRHDAAEEVARTIRAANGTAHAIAADVSDTAAFEAAVAESDAELGPVSLVVNNAGVAMHGRRLHEFTQAEWDWAIGVNIQGVIHGIRTFLPGMLERGTPGHVVNTASIGGFQVNPDFLTAAYSMTKYAVVALSEGLQNELAGTKVGVSVLAPAAVATDIHLAARSRPDRFGGPGERPENHFMGDLIRDGADPVEVGRTVARAVEEERFYIFTHPETRRWIEERHARILEGFAAAERDRTEAAE